jgi:hypothetical protein
MSRVIGLEFDEATDEVIVEEEPKEGGKK